MDTADYTITKGEYKKLKSICHQYPYWVDLYFTIKEHPEDFKGSSGDRTYASDPTASMGMTLASLDKKIKTIINTAVEADAKLSSYIILAACNDYRFEKFDYRYGIKCTKEEFLQVYRKFFWLLNQRRVGGQLDDF